MKQAVLATTLFSFLYASLIVAQQTAVRTNLPPLHLNYFSYLLAAALLITYFFFFKREALKIKSAKGLTFAVFAGIFGSVFADLLALIGMQYSSSVNWGILSRLSTILTFLLAVLLLKERSTRAKVFSVILSSTGAFLVIYKPAGVSAFNKGDLIFLIAAASFAACNVASQKAMEYLSAGQLTLLRSVTAAIVLGAITLIFLPVKEITSPLFILYNSLNLIAGIGLVSFIIKKAGASFFSVGSNLVPIFTVLIAALVLKESPTLLQLLGGTLVIGSILLYQKKYTTSLQPDEKPAR